MKHMLTISLWACSLCMFAQPYFQDEVAITTTGTGQVQVGDVTYNGSRDQYRTYHKTIRGLGVVTFDGTSGSFIDALDIYRTSGNSNFDPIRIIDNGNYTNLLFRATIGGFPRYGLLQYDNTTATLQWVFAITNTNNNLWADPKDMHIDFNTGDIYVTGETYDNINNEYDFFVARVDATGSLQWHNIFPISNRDEHPYSIFYYGRREIYVGMVSEGFSYALDKIGHVVQLDDGGVVQKDMEILYDSASLCNYNRMHSLTVKRLANEVFVFATSAAGRDGAGCFLLSKFDPSLSLIDYKYYHPDTTFYEPLFEFTDNDNALVIMGQVRGFSPNPNHGYMLYSFATSNFANAGGRRYPATFNSFWFPSYFRTAYNVNMNELFSVTDNANTGTSFHVIKSNAYGRTFTDCDLGHDEQLCECKFSLEYPNLYGNSVNVFFAAPNNFTIVPVDVDIKEDCYSDTGGEFVKSTHAGKGPVNSILYPNPAIDYAIVRILGSKAVLIQVYDMQGQLILALSKTNLAEINTLDIASIRPGVYMVKVMDENNHETIHQLIKQ